MLGFITQHQQRVLLILSVVKRQDVLQSPLIASYIVAFLTFFLLFYKTDL